MIKTRFIHPYDATNSKTTVGKYKGKSGVYIIKTRNLICYVGFSSTDVYRTMLRHFQEWNDKNQERIVYKMRSIYTVRVVLCDAKKAAKLEKALILKHNPRDNKLKYEAYKEDPIEKQSMKQLFNEYEDSDLIPYDDVPF